MTSPDTIKRGLAVFAQAQQLHAQKKHADAATAYQRATALLPNHPQILIAYGQLAEDVGDLPAAEKLYRRVGELRPDASFEGRLAIVLFGQQKYAEAIPFLEAYFRKDAGNKPNPDMLHALCNCLCTCGRWEEGLEKARQALAIVEEERFRDSELNALYHLGRTDELDACIDDMLARYPASREIRSLYALHKLKSGDFANGFRFYDDLRWRNNLNQRSSQRGAISAYTSDWDGTPFDGVLVITTEQGLGDEIMLSSMFADLLATGQRAVIECDERLLPIYRRSFPGVEFVARQKEKSLTFPPGTDVRHLAALDLARALRNGSDKFPTRRSWLLADPQRTAALREEYRKRWPGKRLVGLSWKSARIMDGGATKNIDITDFVSMLADRDSRFINLQYGNIAGDLAALRGAGVTLFVDPDIDTMNDIDGLAAQIAALDLVISTSNTTVHVAGALGVPCWLLLPRTRPILWYWGYRGDTTPWYPSLRLLRNAQESNWVALLDQVSEELSALPLPAP